MLPCIFLLTPFIATITHVDVQCNGSAGGSATVTVAGGQPGYTYLWNNTRTTQTVTGLTAGIYTVTVTDHNGCSAMAFSKRLPSRIPSRYLPDRISSGATLEVHG